MGYAGRSGTIFGGIADFVLWATARAFQPDAINGARSVLASTLWCKELHPSRVGSGHTWIVQASTTRNAGGALRTVEPRAVCTEIPRKAIQPTASCGKNKTTDLATPIVGSWTNARCPPEKEPIRHLDDRNSLAAFGLDNASGHVVASIARKKRARQKCLPAFEEGAGMRTRNNRAHPRRSPRIAANIRC